MITLNIETTIHNHLNSKIIKLILISISMYQDNHILINSKNKLLSLIFSHQIHKFPIFLKKDLEIQLFQLLQITKITGQKYKRLLNQQNRQHQQYIERYKLKNSQIFKQESYLIKSISKPSYNKNQANRKKPFKKKNKHLTLKSSHSKDNSNKTCKSFIRQLFRQKIKKQRDQSEKKFQQILSKQNQYKNQSRKNQQIISQLQQKVKNKIIDKKIQIKNKFEVIQEVKAYGPTIILSNSENQFNQFFVSNFEENHKNIIQENQYLKKCLQNVYKELNDLLQVKKTAIKKRKGFEGALDNDAFQLEALRPQTFNLPKQYSQEAITKLGQNLSKFKQALKISDIVGDKVQQQKVQCINNVKNLITNYKQIVENQDKLINRVVLKSKQFKSNEMMSIDNKYGRGLQQDDLQKSKRFLEEQRQILMERNKQLEMTRKAMKNTIKKAQQQKKLFNKKKTQTNQQLLALKKNIQKLPAMVEQELSSMI